MARATLSSKQGVKMKVNQIITAEIINNLEKSGKWVKTWQDLKNCNIDSKRAYTGVNRLITAQAKSKYGFASEYWLTYNQIAKKGGTIKDSQRKNYSNIIFTKTIEKEKDNKKENYFVIRYYRVWNLDQIEGIKAPEKLKENAKIASIDCVLSNYLSRENIEVKHSDNRASYSLTNDYISVPSINQFNNSKEYYQTLSHEVIHSTGAKNRLDRDIKGVSFDKDSYSKEELIAELGALFLLADCEIDVNIKNSASYIKNWLEVLKNDPQIIITASAKAEKAFNFVLSKQGKI